MGYHYFIEDLDVTDDKIPDGILIRQFKMDIKKKQIIYLFNTYISYQKFKTLLKDSLISAKACPIKSILLSSKKINDIKNFNIKSINEISSIIINKNSNVAHLVFEKLFNMKKLLNSLNHLFDLHIKKIKEVKEKYPNKQIQKIDNNIQIRYKKPKNGFYYIIEPIDIDGDINPDGFLISQYKIDKNNNKIFTKNRYMTFELFKKKMNQMKKGGNQPFYKLDKEINGKIATVILDQNKYNSVVNKYGKDLDKLGVNVTIIIADSNNNPIPYHINANQIHGVPPVIIRNDPYTQPYYGYHHHGYHHGYRGNGFVDNIFDGFTFGLGFEFADLLIPDG
jgi:hypothetical protein